MTGRHERARPRETQIAEIVEGLLLTEFGVQTGPRERHDASKGRLRVDFVYEEAAPEPMALEVSSLTDSLDAAGTSEAFQMEDRLSRSAATEGWGAWLVSVSSAASMRGLEPEIRELIRQGEAIRPGDYDAAELLERDEAEARRVVELHRELEQLGLINLEPLKGETGNFVAVLSFGGGTVVSGFDLALREVVRSNSRKLDQARPRRTHLAVDVARFDASRYPHQTPPPELPPEIDMLWIIHRYGPTNLPGVWSLSRGEEEWLQHSMPGD